MHELGHKLGLVHGGGTCDNFKPNYLSVMSYNFNTIGIPVSAAPGDNVPKPCITDADCPTSHLSGAHCSTNTHTCLRIDYSDRQCNDLNECATNNFSDFPCVFPSGLNGGLDETIGLQCGAADTDISAFTTDGINTILVPTNGAPIDWNQDGLIEMHVSQDINGDGATTLLTAFNDWAHLQFNYQCSSNFANDALVVCGETLCSSGQTSVNGKCQ